MKLERVLKRIREASFDWFEFQLYMEKKDKEFNSLKLLENLGTDVFLTCEGQEIEVNILKAGAGAVELVAGKTELVIEKDSFESFGIREMQWTRIKMKNGIIIQLGSA